MLVAIALVAYIPQSTAQEVVTRRPASNGKGSSASPLTQYMLVERATDGNVYFRNVHKVKSLLQQIGFNVSLSQRGIEPVEYTLTATRKSPSGGTTSVKYTCDDMSDSGKIVINFANKSELDAFVYTLDHTGWVKKSRTYTLGKINSDYIWIEGYLNGNTVTLVSER